VSVVLERVEHLPDELIRETVLGHLQFASSQAGDLKPGARVLDFGCGIGASVQALVQLGYDGFGVDVLAPWDSDYDKYWHTTAPPSESLRARLFKIDGQNYRLPFDDNTFDFCFSDQVLEHVFNYEAVFRELARVLKPGAVSAHRFPGPNSPVEAHIAVPFIPLCRYRWYLALWALAGKRSARQQGFNWQDTLRSDLQMMQECNYPTARTLKRIANKAGVRIAFKAEEGLRNTSIGRASRIVRAAGRYHLDGLASRLMSKISQRYLVVYGS
jgi:SAM-dependent methyltransferase